MAGNGKYVFAVGVILGGVVGGLAGGVASSLNVDKVDSVEEIRALKNDTKENAAIISDLGHRIDSLDSQLKNIREKSSSYSLPLDESGKPYDSKARIDDLEGKITDLTSKLGSNATTSTSRPTNPYQESHRPKTKEESLAIIRPSVKKLYDLPQGPNYNSSGHKTFEQFYEDKTLVEVKRKGGKLETITLGQKMLERVDEMTSRWAFQVKRDPNDIEKTRQAYDFFIAGVARAIKSEAEDLEKLEKELEQKRQEYASDNMPPKVAGEFIDLRRDIEQKRIRDRRDFRSQLSANGIDWTKSED